MSAQPRSIAVSIFLLVTGSVLAAALALFSVTFKGPPPRPAPLQLTKLAVALEHSTPPPGNEQGLRIVTRAGQPEPRGPERLEPPGHPMVIALARLLRTPPTQIMVYTSEMQRTNDEIRGPFTVGWRVPGGWRIAETAPPRVLTSWHIVTLFAMLGVLIVLGAAAWWIARRISLPIQRLAEAAKRARPGVREAIPTDGPLEVRELAEAIGAMQARILQQAEGRTVMLGAIAHDLGTPLSRVAFWIEQLPDEARARAAADIDEMRAMLSAALALARDESAPASPTRLDLGSLIESLVDDLAAAGAPVSAEAGPRVVLRGDSAALRRLFTNLVENAVRYGERATLGWRADGGWAEVTVDDAGPGFDPDRAESLFAPFVRGETSRNRATGGTGLGLAIVRSIAEAHGGEVRLETRAGGGGRVRVRLPLG
ncbi:MAG: HAMP domain-containing histidine kinase [Sphingomonas sp.]|uniref:sensor histidine kinase n=1 Tax=Sphingomonas sp. TaxID=28214 RepID=UPI0025DAE7F0|nr:HAMP domain-containing sensor histidine kinase [Sphingomonas sp.]MBX3565291.1 HAMP domain-containing histidine kinase [Sphingomonas sp.]